MKNILLLLSIILMLGNTSCVRERMCKNHTQCPTAPLILEYFGNYKPGNYWIYENQDGTKRDSIYIDNYFANQYKSGESSTKDQSDCIEYYNATFDIHSQYWGTSKILKAEISNGGNCESSKFDVNDSLSYGIFGLAATSIDDTFRSAKQILNFTTLRNTTVYIKGVQYPYLNILLVPNIGIVQFSNRYLTDTFSLIKYNIK